MATVKHETFFITGTKEEQRKWLQRELGLEDQDIVPEESICTQVSSFYDSDGHPDSPLGWNVIVIFYDKVMNPIPGTNISL